MNSWWPTLEASLVSPLSPVCLCRWGVSAACCDWWISGPLCLWFYRLGNTRAVSFCSGKRRPLPGLVEYIAWHGWSTVSYMLSGVQKEVFLTRFVCFLWKTIDLASEIVTLCANSFSQRTLLCSGCKDKTCFTAKASHHPQLGHQYPLFSEFSYSFAEQRIL